MATIRKRGDTFQIRVSLGLDPDTGKQIVKSTTFKAQSKGEKTALKEAEAFAIRFEEKCQKGLATDTKLSFDKCYKYWKETKEAQMIEDPEHSLTQSTYEHYCTDIEKYALPLFKGRAIQSIGPQEVQDMINGIRKLGRKPASIRKYIVSIDMVFKYARSKKFIDYDPMDNIEKTKAPKHRAVKCFNEKEARRFMEVLNSSYQITYKAHKSRVPKTGEIVSVDEYVAEHHVSTMMRTFFTMAYYTGARRGELVALTWKDIDFETKTISIIHNTARTKDGQFVKTTKTEAGLRPNRINEICLASLRMWKAEQKQHMKSIGSLWAGYSEADFDKNFIFIQEDGKQMSLDTPSHAFHEIITRYNENCTTEEEKLPLIGLHGLRHTNATLRIKYGENIEEVSRSLGHSNVRVTLETYTHSTEVAGEKGLSILEECIG